MRKKPRYDDISLEAVYLARIADRLQAGRRYAIILDKPARKGEAWRVEVIEGRRISNQGGP